MIINEAMARLLWPDYPRQNPIGKQLLVGVNTKRVQRFFDHPITRFSGPLWAADFLD